MRSPLLNLLGTALFSISACGFSLASDAAQNGNVEIDYTASEAASTGEGDNARSYDFWQFVPVKTEVGTSDSEELITDRTRLLEVAGVRSRLMTGAGVHGQDTEVTMTEYGTALRIPAYHDDKGNLVLVSAEFSGTHFSGGMKLNNTDPSVYSGSLGAALPEDLYSLDFGLNTRYVVESEKFNGFFKDWTLGFDGYVGSSSDKLFNSVDEVDFTTVGSVRMPIFERQSLTFLAGYSSDLRMPIAGAAYQINWGKGSHVSVGFPMSKVHINSADVYCIETDRFNLDYNWSFLTDMDGRLSYDILRGKLQVYAHYQWRTKSWMRAERTDKKDRLIYTDMLLGAGLRYDFLKHFYIEGECGLVTGRKIWEGHYLTDDSDHGNRLSNSFYGAISAGITF